MDGEQSKLLLSEGEGLTVEFKERFSSRIDEDIVSIAKMSHDAIRIMFRDNDPFPFEEKTPS